MKREDAVEREQRSCPTESLEMNVVLSTTAKRMQQRRILVTND